MHPNPKTNEEMKEFLAHYMPMKFGSALTSKLEEIKIDHQEFWSDELQLSQSKCEAPFVSRAYSRSLQNVR